MPHATLRVSADTPEALYTAIADLAETMRRSQQHSGTANINAGPSSWSATWKIDGVLSQMPRNLRDSVSLSTRADQATSQLALAKPVIGPVASAK